MARRMGFEEQLARSGFDGLTDAEALELLLVRSLRGDRTGAAITLIHRFGSLPAVLAAEPQALRRHLSPAAARDIALVYAAARRLASAELPRRRPISSWTALCAYLRLEMAFRDREAFRVLFLDRKNQLIADEVLGEGTVDHAPVYPREVIRRALELAASAVILAHNHPSGDPTPSAADIDMTRQVVEAGRALRISVHDHVVVARDGIASFKALGLL